MSERTKTLMPDLDKQLRELALTDWERFKELIQLDMKHAYVCMQRAKGRSLRAIANSARMSKSNVERVCKKCPSIRAKS